MKRKFTLLIAALALLTMIVQPGRAWGQTPETFTFSELGYSNGAEVTTVNGTNVTLTFAQGTNSSNAPKYYDTGTAVRMYTGNTLEIALNDQQGESRITAIDFTFSGTSYTGSLQNWTGSETSVSFTNTASGQARIQVITVTYTEGGTPVETVATPTFDPAAGSYTEAQSVNISCETDGATIYYTTDGNAPTTSSDVYSTALSITETTTVKAMAVKEGMNNSAVATAAYTINTPYTGDPYVRITELSNLTDGATVIIAARYNSTESSYYAMTAATTGKPTGVSFTSTTSSNGECLPSSILNEEDTYSWTVGINSNGYTFTNANNQVLGYNSGTNFATGGNNTEWTITRTTAGNSAMVGGYQGFYIVNKNNTGRGIALNNQHNYGPYATSNNNSSDYNFYLDIFVQGYAPASVATPTFSPVAGSYIGTQNVTISCETGGSTIYYTTDGSVPSNQSTQYNGAITVSETTTIKAIAYVGSDASAVATATYSIVTPFTTMQAIFDDATTTPAEHQVYITFDNWVITGANTSQHAFLSDNTKGCIIYGTDHGFTAGDVLSGTAQCKIQLYHESVEITELTNTTTGLTVTPDGNVSVANIPMANLTGVNTGALVSYENLICEERTEGNYTNYYLSDGDTEIQVYRTLFNDYANYLEDGKTYNITGVFVLNNTTKRVNPRSADDIVEVTIPVLTTEDVDIACDATEGVITYTVTNPASDGNLTAEITDGNEGNWLTLGTIGSDIPFTCLANNTTTARTATVTLTYKYNNATETKTATAVVTQAAYVVPTASIVVTPTEVNATAAETEDYLGIDYTALTITESDDFGIQFYDSNNQELNGDDEPDWITAEATTQIGQEGYFVYYYISANTGAARMAYFKVWALDDNSTAVYSNLVTVTQAAGSTPSNQYVRINDLGSLTDGSKVIIAARYDKEHTNGYYAMPGETSGKPTGVAFISEISGGYEIIPTTITSSEDTYSWTVNVTNDGYTFTNANNQMIGWTSSTNFATGGNNTEWTITRETAEETAMVAEYTGFVITNIYTTTTTTTRAFAFNGEKFGPYGTSNMTSATYNFFLDFFVQGATPVVTPSISANDVSITYDAEEGEIVYTINNPVEGGVLTADTEAEWLILDDVDETVPFYCDANTETTARTATVTLTYTYNTNQTVTKDVTVTQAGVPAVMYTVNFTLDGGTFVPNNDFTSDIVEIEAGTYNLPSATKTGFTFAGWNNGINTYAANAEYTVSDNVEFTAQWTETPAGATYTLITDIDQIVSGKHYIIVGLDEGDAYGIGGQATNNRTGTSVTITSNQITAVGDAKELVINGPTDGKYTIYDAAEPGYLYAASNTKNYLKTQTALDDNGKWTISLTNMGVATITAQGANGRNLMRFNPNNGSPLFACYATNSTTGSLPYIYVKDNDTDYEYYGCELTYSGDYAIPADETITIGAGSVMEVTGNLTNTTTSNLIIKDGGQLIHTGDVQATLLKDYDAAPWPSSKGVDGWYTIASPVNGADVSVVTTTANYDFYKYDEAEYKWLNQKVAAHGITTFEQGVGYLYATSEDKQGSFAGTMKATNANIEKDLSYACTVASLKGFNLMGNPFTRNLTNGDVKLGDSYLTTYYVVEGGSELVARQIDTYPIKPGQGFMVQATAENQKLVFNPGSAKGHSANNGYISIAVGNESFNDMAYINVANGNTLRKMTLNADSPKVYVMNNNLDYAAARVEGLSGSMPVCFQTKNIGTYTITIQANELDVEYLHLIDNVLHEDIDMLLEPSYSFIASGHDYAARFTLVFKANANIDEIEVNDNFAYQNGSDIIVNGNGELQVFDVTGRMVMNTKINGIQTVNVPATGMYIFRMVGESVQTQKIVVR